ncbi:MAG TPA: shikimate kinase [Anaerovoracaceae bacterium]|nr:shikimate kinase [Anaerovoracaceae bacterium]
MDNIVLIGMPGCGKSTIGVVLAKVMGYHFIDADLLIQERENRLLSEIIEENGPEDFNRIENEVNSAIVADRAVIATGGSVIYGKEAMAHFRENGVIVYIRLPLDELRNRLDDLAERGISMKEGQTLKDLYDERTPLYEKYAELIIDVEGLSIRESVMLIRERYQKCRKTIG